MRPHFRLGKTDPGSRARRGTLVTHHGVTETPAFMPVGTRATVTGMTAAELRELRVQMILANTYHLLLRPGPEAFRRAGGIHGFMRWNGPVLTDSGGFQIFSLSGDRVITEEGARFKSYVDNTLQLLSPEKSIEMQEAIGSDVMMVLDICLPSTAAPEEIRAAMERTHRWAVRSLQARTRPECGLFAIVQGGLDPALRAQSAGVLTRHPFDGFAIGGLAVGDTRDERGDIVEGTADLLPQDKPRYLMGVGTPPDILEGIARGIDLFDCVLPTTLAWQGTAFTSSGRVKITRSEYRDSDDPLDADCSCATCAGYTRGYLHHIMKCKEPLGPRLLSFHNLHHYLELARTSREAIEEGRFAAFSKELLSRIDRHEHAEGTPGRKTGHRFVLTSSGAAAIRSEDANEVMHPNIGALRESEQLYAAQSKLRERLLEGGPPLVLFDVGLGAASNALAARRISESLPEGARRLIIVSFEQDFGALELALQPEHAAQLGLAGEAGEAARTLLETGLHATPRTEWRLIRGNALQALGGALPQPADVVFWDPFSPRVNPDLWSVGAFAALRTHLSPRATLYTYSSSTTVRAALLLAGFAVGLGEKSGSKNDTTAAAVELEDLARPLGPRFLMRLQRSSAPLPADAPANALELIAALPQLQQDTAQVRPD